MKALTIEEIGAELEKDFFSDRTLKDGTPLTAYSKTITNYLFFKAFCVVGSLLTNLEEVKNGLKRLESEMLSLIPPCRYYSALPYPIKSPEAQAKDLIKYYKSPSTTPKPKDLGSLLSRALERTEHVNGFTGVPATLTANIRPANFVNELLLQRRPFKDPGAGPEHGEFTHRIQWFIIATSSFFRKECSYAAGEVYGQIGEWYFPEALNTRTGSLMNHLSLWDALCDRFGGTVNEFPTADDEDFRNPNKLHPWILHGSQGEKEFPLLHAFLEARAAKRKTIDAKDYLSRKIYGMTYEKLYQEYLRTKDISKLEFIAQNTTDSDQPQVIIYAPDGVGLKKVDVGSGTGITPRDQFFDKQKKYRP